jgi:hypothetical protein
VRCTGARPSSQRLGPQKLNSVRRRRESEPDPQPPDRTSHREDPGFRPSRGASLMIRL